MRAKVLFLVFTAVLYIFIKRNSKLIDLDLSPCWWTKSIFQSSKVSRHEIWKVEKLIKPIASTTTTTRSLIIKLSFQSSSGNEIPNGPAVKSTHKSAHFPYIYSLDDIHVRPLTNWPSSSSTSYHYYYYCVLTKKVLFREIESTPMNSYTIYNLIYKLKILF